MGWRHHAGRRRPRPIARAARLAALAVLLAACGGGGSKGGDRGTAPDTGGRPTADASGEESASFVDLLRTVPASLLDTTGPAGDTPFFITFGDIGRAERAATDLGLEVANPRTTDSVRLLTSDVGVTVPSLALRSPDALPDVAGFDLADIDRFVEFARPPDGFTSATGSFDPAAIGAALGASAFWGPALEERGGDPVTSWVWGDDSLEMNIEGVDAFHPSGRPVQMAADDTRLLVSARIATLDDALGVMDGDAPSITDDDRVLALAAALDDIGAFAAYVSVTPWTFAEALTGLSDDQRAAAGAEPHLGDLAAFALGATAADGELAVAVVLSHDTEEQAATNEGLLRDVLADGHDWTAPSPKPWDRVFSRSTVTRDRTVVTAILVPAEPGPGRWRQMFQTRTSLLATE